MYGKGFWASIRDPLDVTQLGHMGHSMSEISGQLNQFSEAGKTNNDPRFYSDGVNSEHQKSYTNRVQTYDPRVLSHRWDCMQLCSPVWHSLISTHFPSTS